jgi:hypothetical protein
MRAPNVIVLDVFVVREMELGWLCEIAGRPAFLGKLQMPAEGRLSVRGGDGARARGAA